MKYRPSRDIPKAVLELKTISPTEISKWVEEHRTKKLSNGKRVQHSVTPQAISMWFKRNQKEQEKLEQAIKDEELERKGISEVMFQNGFFQEVPCVKTWIIELGGRNAKESSIQTFVGAIKKVCLGKIRKDPTTRQYEVIEEWGIKHPRRLGVEDGLLYLAEMKKRKLPDRGYRLALRNFFESRGIRGRHKISGKITEMGKYAHLFAPKEKLDEIQAWLKAMNFEAYLAVRLAFKCGGWRMGATMTAHAKMINYEDHTIRIEEKATKGKGKRIQEKVIPDDVWKELEDGGRLSGKLVRNITKQEIRDLLRSAYKEIIPDLAEEIPMPFHFWRHQFAQHMLRVTNWNYGLVAKLGNWTLETLERYYGKMDRQTAFKEGRKFATSL